MQRNLTLALSVTNAFIGVSFIFPWNTSSLPLTYVWRTWGTLQILEKLDKIYYYLNWLIMEAKLIVAKEKWTMSSLQSTKLIC